MRNKHILAAAVSAAIFILPGSALAQGADANGAAAAGNSANAAPTTAPANLVMGNSAAAGNAALAAPPAATDATAAGGDAANPAPVLYKVDHGFPWGILGVLGLIGLLPLFRRRDG
jgi:hypothetical protein